MSVVNGSSNTLANEVNALMQRAVESKYRILYGDDFVNDQQRNRGEFWAVSWDAICFCNAYLEGQIYPIDRLDNLLNRLLDILIQFYFIEEELGRYNDLVNAGYDFNEPNETPHLFLARLSVDQSYIMKSRILWERIMNFVYYLETGVELENRVSSNKSKVKVFFEFVNSHIQWQFFNPYRQVIIDHDQQFRTPEVHKNSVLRSVYLGKKQIDPNALHNLINSAMNNIFPCILTIVQKKSINV